MSSGKRLRGLQGSIPKQLRCLYRQNVWRLPERNEELVRPPQNKVSPELPAGASGDNVTFSVGRHQSRLSEPDADRISRGNARRIHAEEMRIQFENRGNLNSNTVPSSCEQVLADEWARKAYDIYCHVWQTQGYVKSASFVRTVCSRAIVPGPRARTGKKVGSGVWVSAVRIPYRWGRNQPAVQARVVCQLSSAG
jgi:hypothetical protein